MLSDEVSQKLFVHTCLVHDGGVPESATEFNGFEENGLSLFKAEVATQSMTEAHATKTWRWDLDVLELECLDHVDGFAWVKMRSSVIEVEAVELV